MKQETCLESFLLGVEVQVLSPQLFQAMSFVTSNNKSDVSKQRRFPGNFIEGYVYAYFYFNLVKDSCTLSLNFIVRP